AKAAEAKRQAKEQSEKEKRDKQEKADLEKKEKKDKKEREKNGDIVKSNSTEGTLTEEGEKVFFEEIATIKDQIALIKSSVGQIEALHQNALNVISEEQSAENTKELERLMGTANKQSVEIRNKLKAMEAANKKLAKSNPSSDVRVRISQHGVVTKKFLDVMNEYQEIQKRYQEKYKQRMQRQFLIVNPTADPSEIDRVMNGESGPVFAQSIVHNGQKAEAQRALRDIQDRHQDVQRIEKSIIELQQLFIDMSVLVSVQGEMLNQIEINVNDAVDQTDKGVDALRAAVKLQKKTRKKMCIIIALLIVAIGIVGLGVYFGVIKK
ncbi:Syntaxin-1A, partial [Irineochytrium annulatum]